MDLPLSYYLSVLMFAGLISFGAFRWNTAWALPYIAVLGMIAAWYFVEPFYFPDLFASFETEYVDTAYTSVLIFISVFSIAAPAVAQRFKPKPTALQLSRVHVSAKHVFLATVALWLVLLAYGTLRMRGDLLGALFPIEGRAGVQMWSRAGGSDAGASGFIVSTAAYLYNLSTAAFGLLLFLLPKGRYRVLAVVLIMISWPDRSRDDAQRLRQVINPVGQIHCPFCNKLDAINQFGCHIETKVLSALGVVEIYLLKPDISILNHYFEREIQTQKSQNYKGNF